VQREKSCCSCHGIGQEEFRLACRRGARSVKACFKLLGRLPKCGNCIPLLKRILREQAYQPDSVREGLHVKQEHHQLMESVSDELQGKTSALAGQRG
jgi:bacterioferritin-associated ferredoxin